MEKIIVRGGKQLNGSVKMEGAKNAVLPVIAATLLASKGTSVLKNVPTCLMYSQSMRFLNI